MKWYEDLYVGESIVHKKSIIKWKILHNAGQIDIFVISLASNPANLLDIIPAKELLQKAYPKKDMYVIGLAKGYEEAVNLTASIINEVYQQTGAFGLRDYLLQKRRERNL